MRNIQRNPLVNAHTVNTGPRGLERSAAGQRRNKINHFLSLYSMAIVQQAFYLHLTLPNEMITLFSASLLPLVSNERFAAHPTL